MLTPFLCIAAILPFARAASLPEITLLIDVGRPFTFPLNAESLVSEAHAVVLTRGQLPASSSSASLSFTFGGDVPITSLPDGTYPILYPCPLAQDGHAPGYLASGGPQRQPVGFASYWDAAAGGVMTKPLGLGVTPGDVELAVSAAAIDGDCPVNLGSSGYRVDARVDERGPAHIYGMANERGDFSSCDAPVCTVLAGGFGLIGFAAAEVTPAVDSSLYCTGSTVTKWNKYTGTSFSSSYGLCNVLKPHLRVGRDVIEFEKSSRIHRMRLGSDAIPTNVKSCNDNTQTSSGAYTNHLLLGDRGDEQNVYAVKFETALVFITIDAINFECPSSEHYATTFVEGSLSEMFLTADRRLLLVPVVGEILAFDVSIPSSPLPLGSYAGKSMTTEPKGVVARDAHIVAADVVHGFRAVGITGLEISGVASYDEIGSVSLPISVVSSTSGVSNGTINFVIDRFPRVADGIANVSVRIGSPFLYTVPGRAFDDPDASSLMYTAEGMPAWLSFNPTALAFSGTPPDGTIASDVVIAVTAQAGTYGEATTEFTILLDNFPAAVGPLPSLSAPVGGNFSYDLSSLVEGPNAVFTDADPGDTLTTVARVVGDPQWLHFNETAQRLYGDPGPADTGTVLVEVTVTDTRGGFAVGTIEIEVQTFPECTLTGTQACELADRGAAVARPFSVTVPLATFRDPDGDPLLFQARRQGGSPLPAWLEFDGAVRTFTGTPQPSDVGTAAIEVVAIDGRGGIAVASFSILVSNPPYATVATLAHALAPTGGSVNVTVSTAAAFADADGDITSLSLAPVDPPAAVPGWITWDVVGAPSANGTATPVSIEITAAPPEGLARQTVVVEVVATDATGIDARLEQQIRVEPFPRVSDVGRAAEASEIPAAVDRAFLFTVPYSSIDDPDGDTIQYRVASILPPWLEFDTQTRELRGTPSVSDVGPRAVIVAGADPAGASAEIELTIRVAHAPRAAVLGVETRIVDAGVPFSVPIAGADLFADDDADVANVTLAASLIGSLAGTPVPGWITLVRATPTDFAIAGTSPGSRVTLTMSVAATDATGLEAIPGIPFTLIVEPFPVVTAAGAAISEQVAAVGRPFAFNFPAASFSDPDGDVLDFAVAPGSIPNWIEFDADLRLFRGTPAASDVGTFSVEVTATDPHGASVSLTFAVRVAHAPSVPASLSGTLPRIFLPASAPFSVTVAAGGVFADSDDDLTSLAVAPAIAVSAAPVPAWLSSISAGSPPEEYGLRLSGDAPAARTVVALRVVATDATGLETSLNVEVAVEPFPALTDAGVLATTGSRLAPVGEVFVFDLPAGSFADPFGDPLTFKAGADLPKWLSFDPQLRRLSGTPGGSDVGPVTVTIEAADPYGAAKGAAIAIVVDHVPVVDTAVVMASLVPARVSSLLSSQQQEASAGDGGSRGDSDNEMQVVPLDAGEPFSLSIPRSAFEDADPDDTLSFGAHGVDPALGRVALPTWIDFETSGSAVTLRGTAPSLKSSGATRAQTMSPRAAETTTDGVGTLEVDVVVVARDPAGGEAVLPLPIVVSAFPTLTTISVPATSGGGNATAGSSMDRYPNVTFPLVTASGIILRTALPSVTAGVGTLWEYEVPSGAFTSSDPLTFAVQRADGGSIPAWIVTERDEEGILTGTPSAADALIGGDGTLDLVVAAITPNGGFSGALLRVHVAHVPRLASPPPNVLLRAEVATIVEIPAAVFEDVDSDTLEVAFGSLAADATPGPLPAWAKPPAAYQQIDLRNASSAARLTCAPGQEDVGATVFTVEARDTSLPGVVSVSATFRAEVYRNGPPAAVKPIPNVELALGRETVFSVAGDTFRDPDGDTLTFGARWSGSGDDSEAGEILPRWLTFEPSTMLFVANPGRADTGPFWAATYVIRIIASDGEFNSFADLVVTVDGESWAEFGLWVGSTAVSVLSSLLVAYRMRFALWNYVTGPKHFRMDPAKVREGELFAHDFAAFPGERYLSFTLDYLNDRHKTAWFMPKRIKPYVVVADGLWLQYFPDAQRVEGSPPAGTAGTYRLRLLLKGGKIHEEMEITVLPRDDDCLAPVEDLRSADTTGSDGESARDKVVSLDIDDTHGGAGGDVAIGVGDADSDAGGQGVGAVDDVPPPTVAETILRPEDVPLGLEQLGEMPHRVPGDTAKGQLQGNEAQEAEKVISDPAADPAEAVANATTAEASPGDGEGEGEGEGKGKGGGAIHVAGTEDTPPSTVPPLLGRKDTAAQGKDGDIGSGQCGIATERDDGGIATHSGGSDVKVADRKQNSRMSPPPPPLTRSTSMSTSRNGLPPPPPLPSRPSKPRELPHQMRKQSMASLRADVGSQ